VAQKVLDTNGVVIYFKAPNTGNGEDYEIYRTDDCQYGIEASNSNVTRKSA
jgi:hypothetical protein